MVRTGGSASAGFNWQFAGRLAVAEARKALDDLAAFAVSHPNNYDGLQAYGVSPVSVRANTQHRSDNRIDVPCR